MSFDIALVSMFIIHWFADFVCQTRKQAEGKSSSWSCLLEHTATYSLIWMIVVFIVGIAFASLSSKILLFPIITFVFHTATDYFTSKATAIAYLKESKKEFWCIVGFDQMLHYIQLYFTYKLLFT